MIALIVNKIHLDLKCAKNIKYKFHSIMRFHILLEFRRKKINWDNFHGKYRKFWTKIKKEENEN